MCGTCAGRFAVFKRWPKTCAGNVRGILLFSKVANHVNGNCAGRFGVFKGWRKNECWTCADHEDLHKTKPKKQIYIYIYISARSRSLGYRGRGTARAPETGCCLASPPSAARPSDRSFLENVWRVGLGTRAGIVCLCRLMPPNPLEMVGGFAPHLF